MEYKNNLEGIHLSAFLNLIALISLITSIVFFVKGFKNKPKFKKAALFFCATWALWFVSAMIDPEPTKVNGKQEDKQEETKKQQEAEQAKDSGLNEVQAQEKAEQLKLAQGQGARNKDVKLSQLGVQTIKDGIQYTTPVQDIHIEAKDSLTRIVAIMPVGTTKEQAKEVGDSLARQVASFGTMGLYVDLHSPSKDYLGEYWENFSGDIGIFDSNEKQLARGYIDKLNPTKIKW